MTKAITTIIIIILLAGCVILGITYLATNNKLKQAQAALKTQQYNEKVVEFTQLFIEKVLKAQIEVDFETRLRLENMVRDLNDEEILAQWQRFIGSQTEAEAQAQVKNLLEMLVKKIKVN